MPLPSVTEGAALSEVALEPLISGDAARPSDRSGPVNRRPRIHSYAADRPGGATDAERDLLKAQVHALTSASTHLTQAMDAMLQVFLAKSNHQIRLSALEDTSTHAHALFRAMIAAAEGYDSQEVDLINIVKELKALKQLDTDQSGLIGVEEFGQYWRSLRARTLWRRARLKVRSTTAVAIAARRKERQLFSQGVEDVSIAAASRYAACCRGGVLLPHGWVAVTWLCILTPLVIYVFLTAPYQITFETYPCPGDPYFVMDVIADFAFLVDIVLQFNLGYYAPGDRQQLVLVTRRADIRRNYLKSWFWFDVVAVIPFNLVEQNLFSGSSGCGESNVDLGAEGYLRAIRLLRVFKAVAKVQKIRSLDKLLRHFEDQFESFYRMLKVFELIKLSIVVCAVAHIVGCVWYGFGDPSDPKSWLHQKFIRTGSCSCIDCANITTEMDCDNACASSGTVAEDSGLTMSCWTPATSNFERYATSVYFACTTLTTVGYGDISPAEGRMIEMVLCVLFMLAGVNIFGIMVGRIGEMVSGADPAAVQASDRIELVDRFLEMRKAGSKTRHKVRLHLQKKYESFVDDVKMNELLHELPYNLAEEVLQTTTVDYYNLQSHSFWEVLQLDTLSPPEVRMLCLHLQPLEVDAFEEVFSQGSADSCIYFVLNGCVEQTARHKLLWHGRGQDGDQANICSLEMRQLVMATGQCFGVVEALRNVRSGTLNTWHCHRASSVQTLKKTELVYLSARSLEQMDGKSNVVDRFEDIARYRELHMVEQLVTMYSNSEKLCTAQERMHEEAQVAKRATHNYGNMTLERCLGWDEPQLMISGHNGTKSRELRKAFLRSGRQDHVSVLLHDLMKAHRGNAVDHSDLSSSSRDIDTVSQMRQWRDDKLQAPLEQLGRLIWEATSDHMQMGRLTEDAGSAPSPVWTSGPAERDVIDKRELQRELSRLGRSTINVLFHTNRKVEDVLQNLKTTASAYSVKRSDYDEWWSLSVKPEPGESRAVEDRKTPDAVELPASGDAAKLNRVNRGRQRASTIEPVVRAASHSSDFQWATDWSDTKHLRSTDALEETRDVNMRLEMMQAHINRLDDTMQRIAEKLGV